MKFTCFIPGKPEPQGSTRAFVVAGRARVTSDNPKLKTWRCLAVDRMEAARGGHACPMFAGAVCVMIEVCLPRLSSHPKTHKGKMVGWPGVKPDLDKLLRAVGDALMVAGIVADDSSICQIVGLKRYADLGEQAGMHLEVIALEDREQMALTGILEANK